MAFKYKYETHVHTNASSKCGKSTPEEMVQYYKKLGFTGLFITDHFYKGNTCIDKDLPWKKWVKEYCKAYKRAKKEGAKIGMQVFFGWETTYSGEDFLIVGLDEKWLLEHEEILECNQAEQMELVHRYGGYVIQAHPFRERHYQSEVKLHPYHADAFEVCNACNNYYEDMLAYDYALAHHIPMTAGSDIHRAGTTKSHCIFGIETEKKIKSAKEYAELIISGTGYRMNLPDGYLYGKREFNPAFPTFEFDKNHERHEIAEFYPDTPKAVNPREAKALADMQKQKLG